MEPTVATLKCTIRDRKGIKHAPGEILTVLNKVTRANFDSRMLVNARCENGELISVYEEEIEYI